VDLPQVEVVASIGNDVFEQALRFRWAPYGQTWMVSDPVATMFIWCGKTNNFNSESFQPRQDPDRVIYE
jgi:hypothetical protein